MDIISILFFFAFLLMFFIGVGIPLIIGIVVYRDANKRVDCNPWLWALIAALVPTFVGVIIYVIIRKDFPLKPEHQPRAGDYGQSSYEFDFDENGEPVIVTSKPNKGFPTWAKVLLIVGLVLVVIGMIAGCGALIHEFVTYNMYYATPEFEHHDYDTFMYFPW